jgi:hypothetical protein
MARIFNVLLGKVKELEILHKAGATMILILSRTWAIKVWKNI